MRINFFEEYPSEENLTNLDLVDWPATVFVATPSLEAFEKIRDHYATRYPSITFGWWPTLPESYWVSVFSSPRDLKALFSQLTSKVHEKELLVLIDLELPLKKRLYLKNIFFTRGNKKKILAFFSKAPSYNIKISTAEYPSFSSWISWIWRVLGLSPSLSYPHTKIPMCYSSMGLKLFSEILLV